MAEQGRGDPRFHKLLRTIGELHDKKQQDYGSEEDPFANVRASAAFGIPAWVGCMVRANDKMHRIKVFAKRGSLSNESVRDSLMDLAVYSLIGLVLYDEESGAAQVPAQMFNQAYNNALHEVYGLTAYGDQGEETPIHIRRISAEAAIA